MIDANATTYDPIGTFCVPTSPDTAGDVGKPADVWPVPPEMDVEHLPLVPLTAPMMPPPGLDFIDLAVARGDPSPRVVKIAGVSSVHHVGEELKSLYAQALYDRHFHLMVQTHQGQKAVQFLPGHLWGSEVPTGPQPAQVMVIGKHPSHLEECFGTHFRHDERAGRFLQEMVSGRFGRDREIRIRREEDDGWQNWYMTCVCKFPPPVPGSDRIDARWIKDCLPLLHMEVRLVGPKYILCVGADAARALFGPDSRVEDLAGRIHDYPVTGHKSWQEVPEFYLAKVVVMTHPAVLRGKPERRPALVAEFSTFATLVGYEHETEPIEIDIVKTMTPMHVASPLPIRPMTMADRDVVLQTLVAARRPAMQARARAGETVSDDNLSWFINLSLRRFFEASSETGVRDSFVAKDGDVVAGVILVLQGGNGPFIWDVGVRPEYRRRGVATALLARVTESLLPQGHSQLGSSYDFDDPGWAAWYAARGFQLAPSPLFTVPGPAIGGLPIGGPDR